jgi:hypothetical protein
MGTIDDNDFKAIWDGYIDIPTAGEYTFYLNSFYNDICKLTIDNQEIINKNSGPYTGVEYFIEKSGTINFSSPGKKKIHVFFEETDWVAAIELFWESPSISKQLVPQKSLFTSIDQPTGNGLNASYLGNVSTLNGISQKYLQIDETIDFNWATGSPNISLLGNDLYTIIWQGYLRPPLDDHYTFTISGDDGFILILDNDTIINQWQEGIKENKETTIYLEGRTFYPIELRYFENKGNANIKLEWSSSILSKGVIAQKYLYTDLPIITSVKTDSKDFSNKLVLAKDGTRIKLISDTKTIESFDIYTITGTKIVSGKTEIQHQWIDMSKYPEGLYIIHLLDNGEPKNLKFLR